jgi:hypothetical protein
LLDRNFGYSFQENPKYGGGAHQQKKEEKEGSESIVNENLGLKCVAKDYLEAKIKGINKENR